MDSTELLCVSKSLHVDVPPNRVEGSTKFLVELFDVLPTRVIGSTDFISVVFLVIVYEDHNWIYSKILSKILSGLSHIYVSNWTLNVVRPSRGCDLLFNIIVLFVLKNNFISVHLNVIIIIIDTIVLYVGCKTVSIIN